MAWEGALQWVQFSLVVIPPDGQLEARARLWSVGLWVGAVPSSASAPNNPREPRLLESPRALSEPDDLGVNDHLH